MSVRNFQKFKLDNFQVCIPPWAGFLVIISLVCLELVKQSEINNTSIKEFKPLSVLEQSNVDDV